jgi:hypothetical protein
METIFSNGDIFKADLYVADGVELTKSYLIWQT